MRIELHLGCQAGKHHPCDSGCRLGWRSEGKLLHVERCIGNWPVLHCWPWVGCTSNCVIAESEAKAITKGSVEALHVKHVLEHQTARQFKIEVWTDSSSANRAEHWEVQTFWVQQLVKIGLISLNKVDTLENVRSDKTCATSCSRQVSWNDGFHNSW